MTYVPAKFEVAMAKVKEMRLQENTLFNLDLGTKLIYPFFLKKKSGYNKANSSTPLKNNKKIKCAQNMRCTSSMSEQSLCKIEYKGTKSVRSYRLHKPDANFG